MVLVYEMFSGFRAVPAIAKAARIQNYSLMFDVISFLFQL